MSMRPLHVLLLAVAASGCAGSGSAPDADTDTADAPDADTADAPVASDEDGDGYLVSDGDCAEDDPAVHPGAPEACNGVDDDCDGVVDEDPADAPAWYGDSDGDGYGATTVAIAACDAPSDAFVATDGDCDDGDAAVHPGAEEACTDPTDRNCDGSAGATDADGDGTPACEDCDDADAAVSPGAVEACGGGDEDCDGATDEAGADGELEGYADADGDTFGDPAVALLACTLPEGFVANAEDCDDAAAGVNPGAAEACGGGDEDCDGAVDDADPTLDPATAGLWHVDVDGDTFGAAGPYDRAACVAPAGWIADATDCDDADAGDHPGAEETVGNEEDDDCDGLELCYADADADAYRTDGTVASVDADCADVGEAALGSAAGDCDDADAAVSPGAADTCNGVDDDCDGATDEDVGTEYYVDADEDGYGDSADSTIACSLPSGYAEAGGDCDDDSALASPGGTEACGDGLDNDCDAAFDDCNLAGERLAASADLQVGGANASDYFGRALATGDFDGDGAPDLFAGVPGADGPGSAAGGTALLYGPISGSGATMAPRLNGPAAASYAGFSVASGDHDGDGTDDLLVGAYGISSYAGAAYLVYGGARFLTSNQLTTVVGTRGATFTGGAALDYFGFHVASGGDMDGDGTDEIVVGAYLQDTGATSGGAAYLLYGSATRSSGTVASTAADATVRGTVASGYLGEATAFVDDMDGDGLDELLLGAYGTNRGTGVAYLFLGGTTPLSGVVSATDADLSYNGSAETDYAGFGVYTLGDLDGDGYGDAGVHGYGYDLVDSRVGALWVYGGGTSLVAAAEATVYGAGAGDCFGGDAMSLGDLDGDGADDLLAGAYLEDTAVSSAGAAYLFYGPVSGSVSAAAADATWYGAPTGAGHFGRRMPRDPTDLTGDGLTDVVVGAYWDDTYGYDAGAVYIWAGLGGE